MGEGVQRNRVKSKHVHNRHLWMIKLQMILIPFILFLYFIHFTQGVSLTSVASKQTYLLAKERDVCLKSSENLSESSAHVYKCF